MVDELFDFNPVNKYKFRYNTTYIFKFNFRVKIYSTYLSLKINYVPVIVNASIVIEKAKCLADGL